MVRLLLDLGVSLHPTSGFFWDYIAKLRKQRLREAGGAHTESATNHDDEDPYAHTYYRYNTEREEAPIRWAVSAFLGQPQPSGSTEPIGRPLLSNSKIANQLCQKYKNATYMSDGYSYFGSRTLGDVLDPLQVAVGVASASEPILRMILETLQEDGYLATDAGKASLEKCLEIALKCDRLEFLPVLQSYSDAQHVGVHDLVSALCAQDIEAARSFLNNGERISNDSLLSVFRSNNLPLARDFIFDEMDLELEQLNILMRQISNTHYRDRETSLALARRLLSSFKLTLKTPAGIEQLGKWFADSSYSNIRFIIRPYLPKAAKGNHAKAILSWDLEQAIAGNNIKEIKSLGKQGAMLSTSALISKLTRFEVSAETASAVLDAIDYVPAELEEILVCAVTTSPTLIDVLLSNDRKVKPWIGYKPLRECMVRSKNKYIDTFERLMVYAANQDGQFEKHNLLARMAISR